MRMPLAFCLLCLTLGASTTLGQGAEPGFGGAAADVVEFTPPPTRAADRPPDPAAAPSETTPVGRDGSADAGPEAPEPTDAAPPTETPLTAGLPPTKLEQSLLKARLDPARFPLLQVRVDVARLEAALKDFEGRGLTKAREAEAALAEAKALLLDVERIGMHRMNVCLSRSGRATPTRNYRMTPAGPVRLSTQEMIAQSSLIDPDGCARIELVDAAIVARLKRAHSLQETLEHTNFPYHRVAEQRALEDELKVLKKQLAAEDLPVIALPGAQDPYGR